MCGVNYLKTTALGKKPLSRNIAVQHCLFCKRYVARGKKKQRIDSSKFNLTYKSKAEAQNIENEAEFGEFLLSHVQTKRKRYRGSYEGGPSGKWDDDYAPATSTQKV